jgi:hypothetical protein
MVSYLYQNELFCSENWRSIGQLNTQRDDRLHGSIFSKICLGNRKTLGVLQNQIPTHLQMVALVGLTRETRAIIRWQQACIMAGKGRPIFSAK